MEKEIVKTTTDTKQQHHWEGKFGEIEQLIGDLCNYTLLAAMETAKLQGKNRQLAISVNNIKETTDGARNLLNGYKNDADSNLGPIVFGGTPAEISKSFIDTYEMCENGTLRDQYSNIMLFIINIWESSALQALVEAYKNEIPALMVCLEEIRKSALQLRNIFKNNDNIVRPVWKSESHIIASTMRLNSKKSEYLSFNIGGVEIIEELANILVIVPYKGVHEFLQKSTSGEFAESNFNDTNILVKVDSYINMYKSLNLLQPVNNDDMQIIGIRVPVLGDSKKTNKIIAVAVDFVNYPLLTAAGDNQISTNHKIKSEYIRGCWHLGNYTVKSTDKPDELLFLDWQKLLADHEASTKQPEFEDLLNLSDLEIQSILKKCELYDLVLALKGCSPSLKHKIEDNLSEKVKLQLKEEFAKTEAVPLAEVEKAQDKIVNFAFSKE